jgi:hypothetical protein
MVAHTCNSAFKRLRLEDFKFEARLGYIVRPWVKTKKKKSGRKLRPRGAKGFAQGW